MEGILAKSLAGKHHYFEKKHWLCTTYIDSSSTWGFLGIWYWLKVETPFGFWNKTQLPWVFWVRLRERSKGQSHHATSGLFLSPVCLMFSTYVKPLPKREGPYYCFYWSTWGWSNPIIVFLVNKPLWLAHSQHWALPKLEPLKCFPNLEHRVLLLQPFGQSIWVLNHVMKKSEEIYWKGG